MAFRQDELESNTSKYEIVFSITDMLLQHAFLVKHCSYWHIKLLLLPSITNIHIHTYVLK